MWTQKLSVLCLFVELFSATAGITLEQRVAELERNVLIQTYENAQLKERLQILEEKDARTKETETYGEVQNHDPSAIDAKIPMRQGLDSTCRIAFHAYKTGRSCLRNNQILLFNNVEIDIGSGYNVNSGIYVVPVSGVYVMSWTILSKWNEWYQTNLYVNGAIKGKILTDSENYKGINTATGLIVVKLKKGDHVFVRRIRGDNDCIIDDDYARATFSGWLLM